MSLDVSSGKLDVPGARLAYQIWKTSEDKPWILLIAGCTAFPTFATLAEILTKNFTVLGYERRGYGESLQNEPPVREELIKTNGDDAGALIQHFSPSKPITVFGTSGGAMMALELLRSHPNLIELMILHEPPIMTCLGDEDLAVWDTAITQVASVYHSKGIKEAVELFGKYYTNEEDARLLAWAMNSPEAINDAHYFFKHELETLPIFNLDFHNLAANNSKLIFIGGALSKDQLPYKPMEIMARKIHLPITEVAGGHIAYVNPRDAPKFSNQILELSQRS